MQFPSDSRPVTSPLQRAPSPYAGGVASQVLAGHGAADEALPSVDSAVLMQGHRTVHIAHNGSVYRLQATKLGKLILTK